MGEYLAERAALRQAETDLDVRRGYFKRAQELIKLEAIAQQTLELRQAEHRNAEAAVASQRARVSKVEEQLYRFGLTDPDLEKLTPEEGPSAHRAASHNVLRAPFAGIITAYDVAPGELVEPDRELLTLTDLSTVWVLADVYEKDLGRIRPNTEVTITVDAYSNREFTGRLTYISDMIDPRTRTAKVRCVVSNADGALKLEMFARIEVPTTEARRVLTVPVDAVQRIDNQPVVFVQQSAERFARRDVELGATAAGRVEIRSGLEAGEPIVAVGSFYLKTALLRERIGDEH